MKYQVNAIAPLSTATLFAAVCFLVTLPFLLIGAVTYGLSVPEGDRYPQWAAVVLVPLVNAFFGFFIGLVLAICYNLAAKHIGGFELTLQEKRD